MAYLVVLNSVPPRHGEPLDLALRRRRLQRPLHCLGQLAPRSLTARTSALIWRTAAMARVAYLMSHYPAISHAFVLREVEHVARGRCGLHTLSIHRARTEDLLSEADRRAAATTYGVLPTSVGAVAARTSTRSCAPRAAICRRWPWPCAPGRRERASASGTSSTSPRR
jgi:hypothetical protein